MSNILAGALVLVTFVYAILTFMILKANQASVEQMKAQQQNMLRPYIVISPVVMSGTGMFLLRIKNSGISAAQNLRLSIDRNFYQFGMRDNEKDLKCFTVFNKPIDTFAPGAEIMFHLGLGKDIFAPSADPNPTPTTFSISAQYCFLDRDFSETSIIDLMPYREGVVSFDPLISELEKMTKVIENKQ